MSKAIKLTILGEPASKSNSRKIVTFGKHPASIKSDKARAYEKAALAQIPPAARKMLTGPVRLVAKIFYASERPDLDESVILDILQNQYKGKGEGRQLIQKGVYQNDRQVREKHIYHGIDKRNPRAVIVVEPLQMQQEGML